MADYVSKLAEQRATKAARVTRVRAILKEIGGLIGRYRGGMPAGFAAAVAQWESNAQMGATGDAGLGEAGIYQVTAAFPTSVGVPPATRYTLDGNVFLGMLEYQIEAAKMYLAERAIGLGTVDSWKFARLAFAIGSGGAKTLIKESGPHRPGRVWEAVRSYVDRVGGRAFGSQSAGLVWYRVHAIDLVWEIGQAAAGGSPGYPTLIPSPPGIPYSIPASVRPYFRGPTSPLVAVAAVLAIGAVYLTSRS